MTEPQKILLAGQTDASIVVPTHVYGAGAEQLAAKWGAKWSTGIFAEFRKTFHFGKPLVVAFTGSVPTGQDWYLGERVDQEIYLVGAEPGAKLKGDAITASRFAKMYVKGLDLENCGIMAQSLRTGAPTNTYVTECYIHDTVGDQNAIGSPNEDPGTLANYYIWDTTFSQCGSQGNTTHMMYIHGRPDGLLWVDNITVLGTQGCSAIKSTMVNNQIRNSYLSTVQNRNDISVGFKAAMLIDVPADSESIVDHNTFIMYKGPVNAVPGQLGLDAGAIAWRARREFHASDRPIYKSPEWYAYDWKNAQPFKKEVTNNHFVLLPGSRKTPPVNAFGTHPRRAVKQFSTKSIIEMTHADWQERDYTLDRGNTYEGFPAGYEQWSVYDSEGVAAVEVGAKWGFDTSGPVPKYWRTVPSKIVTEW